MSDLTKVFLISFATSVPTAVLVYVLMTRNQPQRDYPPPPAAPAAVEAAQPRHAPPPDPVLTEKRGDAPAVAPAPTAAAAIELPNLVGRSVTRVKGELAKSGLRLVLAKSGHHATVPADHVVAQSPLAGSMLRSGGEVEVEVSRGPRPTTVPELVGLAGDAARAKLQESGLTVGDVTSEESDQPQGQILSTRPAGGAEIAPGAPVHFVVSEGPELAKVPRVVRRRTRSAKTKLEEAGFVPSRVLWTYNQDYEPGIIVRQQPRAGEMAPRGSEVRLWGSEPDE